MTIQANLADGRVLNFPDGTDPAIIQSTVKGLITGRDQTASEAGIEPIEAQTEPGGNEVDLLKKKSGQIPFGQDISTIAGQPVEIDPEERARREETLKTLTGIPEAIATIGTGAIAEPVAGLVGIGASLIPGEEGQGARAVKRTREALTFQPVTESGKKALSTIGSVVDPVARFTEKMESGLGDLALRATGSPALAAAATTIPTIVSELVGAAGGKALLTSTRNLKKLRAAGKIAREIKEAVPDIDQLKTTARAIYKEIDDTGAVIKEKAFTSLSEKITSELNKSGLDPDITPKASKALQRFQALEGKQVTVTELDTLRKVAQNAAKSIEPAEASLGVRMINTIDDFMDKSGPNLLRVDPSKDVSGIGKKYKIARDLWGRARKSELLQESFEKARNQASGFENGVRVQFRSILNNKKKRKFFNKQEIDAMTSVVRGGKAENFAKLVGRLGFSEGGATNILGGAAGVAGGAAVGGAPGAVIVPLVGQVSRKLAQRMTVKGAEFADQVIRAGKDARKITQAYLKNTPKDLRNPSELSELLMRQDIDLSGLPKNEFIDLAKNMAMENRAVLAASIASQEGLGATTLETEDE